jgi:hypothetical protein
MPRTTKHHACNHSDTLEAALLEEILSLTPTACVSFLATLVGRMGYEASVPTAEGRPSIGRTTPSIDLRAERPVPGGLRSAVVRLKRYHPGEPVFRRHVDELRGVALRSGAAEAVLITTSAFPPSVTSAGYPSAPLVPVRLIDGAELARLCATHRVGVWEEVGESPAEPVARGVEYAFFRSIESPESLESLGSSGPGQQAVASGMPALRVSVAVRVTTDTSGGLAGNRGLRPEATNG